MSKPKVLLLGIIDHAHDTWASLAERSEVIEPKATNRADFIKECKDGKLEGVVACYRTFNSVSVTGLWDEELVKALPKSLKSVAHNGAGYDQLTISALSSRSILATNVPTAVDDATADTALFLLLGALRNYNSSIFALRAGDWRGKSMPELGHDPQGKLLGVLGMGGIGSNFARKAKALGMSLQYHNRRRLTDPEKEVGATYVEFEELLRSSDVVMVSVPLNQHTRHLLGKEEFAKCKKGVVIVNTARGAVIDEAAMVEALESGQIGSVGLDVFEEEPKIHPGLVKHDRAFLLPHMGTYTLETQKKMEDFCINNVVKSLEWNVEGKKGSGREMSIVGEQKDLFEKLMSDS